MVLVLFKACSTRTDAPSVLPNVAHSVTGVALPIRPLTSTVALDCPVPTVAPPPLIVICDGSDEVIATKVGATAGAETVTCNGVKAVAMLLAPAATALSGGPKPISPDSKLVANTGSSVCPTAFAANKEPLVASIAVITLNRRIVVSSLRTSSHHLARWMQRQGPSPQHAGGAHAGTDIPWQPGFTSKCARVDSDGLPTTKPKGGFT